MSCFINRDTSTIHNNVFSSSLPSAFAIVTSPIVVSRSKIPATIGSSRETKKHEKKKFCGNDVEEKKMKKKTKEVTKKNKKMEFKRRSDETKTTKIKSSNTSKRDNKKFWNEENDNKLMNAINKCNPSTNGDIGKFSWTEVAKLVSIGKSAKQCRDRWSNHLRDGIKKGGWTIEEEHLITNLYRTFGGRWCSMTKVLKNRSENDIKNKWNSMKRTRNRRKNNTKSKKRKHDIDPAIVDKDLVAENGIIPIEKTSNDNIPFEITSGNLIPVINTTASCDFVNTETNDFFDFTTDLDSSIDALYWNSQPV